MIATAITQKAMEMTCGATPLYPGLSWAVADESLFSRLDSTRADRPAILLSGFPTTEHIKCQELLTPAISWPG